MSRVLALGLLAATVAAATPALSDGGHTFANCAEARTAGYSNIPRGSYGYGPRLDRDNDGIACES